MLENEVVSLKLAKKLKELGYPQKKSSLKWYGFYEIQCFSVERQDYILQTANVEDECVIEIGAPLATEILRELPSEIIHDNEEYTLKIFPDNKYGDTVGYYWEDSYGGRDVLFCIDDFNLSNAIAKMWIQLKESKYI